ASGDADSDGMPDNWEIANALSPGNPNDAGTDDDGDGFSNLQEYIARTNPHDASSGLRIVSVAADGTVQFTSVLGRVYRLKRSDDLSAWTVAVDNIAGTGGNVSATDPGPLPSARYYRVEVLP